MKHQDKVAAHAESSPFNVDENDPRSQDPNRETGPRAILVLMGAFFALFTTVGLVGSFGVFQEYYMSHQLYSKSPFDISWIGSFSSFMLFAGAVPAGILVDKIGPFVPLVFGSVCVLLGIFMTSLCTQYYQFFLAQSLLLGIGFAFVLCPAAATMPRYFEKHRALAVGGMAAGSSTGGVIWPIMLNNLLNSTSVGFGWTLRIVGFVMLPFLVFVCLTVRLPLPRPQGSASVLRTALDRGEPADPEKTSALQTPVHKNSNFFILCAGLGFIYLGFFGPFFFVSSYSVSLGQSTSFSFYLVSIMNGASFFGRIVPGIVADRYGSWNLIIIATLTSAVIAFCWTAATSVGGIVVWAMAYGFASGAILSTQVTCAVSLASTAEHGKAVGMVMGSVSLTGLFGSPICGQLLEHYGYLAMSMFNGACLVAGALIVTVARLRLDSRILAVK